ncbi:MAG: trehalose-phosphatase [Anaeromyxobacter sp.]
MEPILTAEAAPVLRALARRRALLAFDLDGTLAPLVADPAAAGLRPETRRLLRVLALLAPCAVLSGRRRADAARRLEGIPLVAVVGGHGSEPGFGPLDAGLRAQVAGWRERVAAVLAALPGVRLEDKGLSLALHHRGAGAPHALRRRLVGLASALPGARVLLGRDVVQVLPEEAPDKGRALEALLRREELETALYVGDDPSDEDAFRAEGVAVGVRVGRSARSAARWYLASQADVDALLRALIAARAAEDGRADRAAALEAALR